MQNYDFQTILPGLKNFFILFRFIISLVQTIDILNKLILGTKKNIWVVPPNCIVLCYYNNYF